MKILSLIISLASILLLGCDKAGTVTEDANYFYCTIDEKIYQPAMSGSSGFKSYKNVYLQTDGNRSLLVVGGNVSFSIYDSALQLNQPYPLGPSGYRSNSGKYYLESQDKKYTTNEQFTGTVTLTARKNGFIAGRFEYTAIDSSSNQLVKIENGIFNLRNE